MVSAVVTVIAVAIAIAVVIVLIIVTVITLPNREVRSCDVYGLCALWDLERGVKTQAPPFKTTDDDAVKWR